MYDYEQLLGLSKGYSIGEFKVRKGGWMDGEKLKKLKFDEEGVTVLGIYRKVGDEEKYFGNPGGDTELMEGDIIVCYGPEEAIREISCRLKGAEGNRQHREAVKKEKIRRAEEEKEMKEMQE